MFIKLANLKVRGLKDREKAARLFCDLGSFGVDLVAIQETYCL